MRRFLHRITIFALISITLLGGWTAVLVGIELHRYRNELKMPPGAHVLVCGDSQPAHALDPARWPGLFNFSLDATLLDQSRMKTADILAANPGRVDMLILDISPWKYYGNDPAAALEDEGAAAAQFLVNILHWRDNRRPFRGLVKILRDTLLVKKTSRLNRLFSKKRPYRSSLCGGYVKTDKAHFLDQSEIVPFNIRRLTTRIAVAPKAGEGTATFNEWRLTIDLARRNGVKDIVLITTPFHQALRDAIGKERLDAFKTAVRAFAREIGCPYRDFLEMPLPNAAWRDANHLNEVGAALFTDACRKAVQAQP